MIMTCYTNYCFEELGDKPYSAGAAPIRQCKILGYDGDKRLLIEVNGLVTTAHRSYVNPSKRRLKRLRAMKYNVIMHIVHRHKLRGAYWYWIQEQAFEARKKKILENRLY